MGLWAFVIAGVTGLISQTAVKQITIVAFAFAVLLGVILVGIVFDIIGVAVAAAQEPPLHARATKRLLGAREAVGLVRNAHQVASFCNDVAGDIAGTLSGAIGITIIYQLVSETTPAHVIYATALMTAGIAGITVGGKAYGKVFAIRQGTEIIFHVGQLVATVKRFLRFLPIPPRRR